MTSCFEIDLKDTEQLISSKIDQCLSFLNNALESNSKENDALRYIMHYMNEKSSLDFLSPDQKAEIFVKVIFIRLAWKQCVADYLSDTIKVKLTPNLLDVLQNMSKLTLISKEFRFQLNESPDAIGIFFLLLKNDDSIVIKKTIRDKSYKNSTIENVTRLTLSIILNMSQSLTTKNKGFSCFSELVNTISKQTQKFNFERWFIILINENLDQINLYDNGESTKRRYNSDDSVKLFDIKDKNDCLSKNALFIAFLQSLYEKDFFEAIAKEEQSLDALLYLKENNLFNKLNDQMQSEFVIILIDCFSYFYFNSLVDLLKFNRYMSSNDPIIKEKAIEVRADLQTYATFMRTIALIILIYSNDSMEFCIKFHRTNEGIKALINFVLDDNLNAYLREQSETSANTENKETNELCIICLHNLSRVSSKFIDIWNNLKVVESCIKLAEDDQNDKLKFFAYTILANVASDEQISNLKQIKTIVQAISDFIKEAADLLANKKAKRELIQINEEAVKVCTLESGWNLAELMDSLYNLSVNDDIKRDMFNIYLSKEYFIKLISYGNDAECEYTAKLLYQLCFDKEIVQSLVADTDMMNLIKNIVQSKEERRKSLIKYCQGILWKCSIKKPAMKIEKKLETQNYKQEKDFNKQSEKQNPEQENSDNSDAANVANAANAANGENTVSEETKSEASNDPKHIMISYNKESRDTCMQIKKQLEEWGHKVWIDVENISGSSLESMANAIENSHCVLMGMTQKYKLSANCRLEAEYTMTLNKPIIPLILQNNYTPDGWLGIILGSKIFINFKKYDFAECARRLKLELDNLFNVVNSKPADEPKIEEMKETKEDPPPEKVESKSDSISRLTKAEVQKMISDKNFHPHIIKLLKNCDGKMLYQIYLMLKLTPEFFYKTLHNESNNSISIVDVALFAFELKKLFED